MVVYVILGVMLQDEPKVAFTVATVFTLAMVTAVGLLEVIWSTPLYGLMSIITLIGLGISIDLFAHIGHFYALSKLRRKAVLFRRVAATEKAAQQS